MVGISGGCYALLGAMMIVMPRVKFPLVLSGATVAVPMWAAALIITAFYGLFDLLLRPNVAIAAHVAGLASGALVGVALKHMAVPNESAFAEARIEESLVKMDSKLASDF